MTNRAWLPERAALLRVAGPAEPALCHWDGSRLRRLPGLRLAQLLALTRAEMVEAIAERLGEDVDVATADLLAPCDEQEVWAAGVTYERSRTARMDEAREKDIYDRVYAAERPELFFKAAGWRVVAPGGEAGIRADSTWDVPEPELVLLTNSRGEVVGWTCGNDMSSRSIEGENPLYLPQAKVYDRSCSLGPGAVLGSAEDARDLAIRMEIHRGGRQVFEGQARTSQLIREPAALAAVLHSSYPLPNGAWLMTGTAIVPAPPYTAEAGDTVAITIEATGTLVNRLVRVPHSGARALPKQAADR